MKTMVEPPFSGEVMAELVRAVLGEGKAFRFRALGLSMTPFIKDGDVVTVAPLASSRPRTGEIAAFVHPDTGKLRVHRIIGTKEGRYLLKGDNALEADGDVPAEHVLGLVVRVERDGRAVRTGRGWCGAVIARMSRSALAVRAFRRFARVFLRDRRKA